MSSATLPSCELRSSPVAPARISVVICTYNRVAMLADALASVRAQETSGEFEFEILVVDDGSSDATAEVVTGLQETGDVRLRYLQQNHGGIAAARNRGVREAWGDWIAFCDDDQIAGPTWLLELLRTAWSKAADCVGGPCLLRLSTPSPLSNDPTIRRLLGEEPLFMNERSAREPRLDPRQQEAVPGTGNVLVKKELFDRVGMFSEARTYGEDREFFKRALQAGARCSAAPAATMYHIVPPSRLTAAYLLKTAALGGQTQAEIDPYWSAVWHALFRAAFLLGFALPRLGLAWLTRNEAKCLARRCSVRFSWQYIATVAKRGRAWPAHEPALRL